MFLWFLKVCDFLERNPSGITLMYHAGLPGIHCVTVGTLCVAVGNSQINVVACDDDGSVQLARSHVSFLHRIHKIQQEAFSAEERLGQLSGLITVLRQAVQRQAEAQDQVRTRKPVCSFLASAVCCRSLSLSWG